MTTINKSLVIAVLLLGAGIFAVPAIAQNGGGMMDRGMGNGGMTRGMSGMMSRGMGEGCMEMMQGMRNGGGSGRPNAIEAPAAASWGSSAVGWR